MTLLLQHRAVNAETTEQLVVEIVGSFDAKVVALLLQQRGSDIRVTEKVAGAAAENFEDGDNIRNEVLALLLKHGAMTAEIT